ncbi:MAG TPA: succinate-semialdehyde dehydrogenase (NADP(+)) [Cyanobacteria bacterium UBA8803]|nr:succinate-semialdehyde dehydrogenase (NADP(+)) [Cyanobacteria bacterium UBA8803]
MLETQRWQLFIDGKFVEAENEQTYEVKNPADGNRVGIVPNATGVDTRKAIAAAQAAFKLWSKVSAKERGQLLRKVQDVLSGRVSEIARLITLENGKPYEEAKKEVAFGIDYFGWFAEEARRTYGDIVPSPSTSRQFWVTKQPIGVVAAITPWNFPATMVTRKIAPALAAGCTVVLKPAPNTPLTALAIAAALRDAGIPPGVFNVITTEQTEVVGEELLTHPAVRKIAFTGSTRVGKQLMERAASQLKRVSFELGGNAPLIVFDDADIDSAVEAAVAIKFLRVGGQSCICANRIFVQDTIADQFTTAFLERVNQLKVGQGFEPGMHIGPLINEKALNKVSYLVEDARERGAKVVMGGQRLTDGNFANGYFYPPTVLLNVEDSMPICREEIFGPVAPILTFSTEEEVIERANHSQYGLASYLFTRNLVRILRLSDSLDYGLVGVNDVGGYTHEVPFGGFKESGIGREGGRRGIEEYMEEKTIVINLNG